jgi:glutamyl-tRNA synthetase
VSQNTSMIGRFAPSPTGPLHVGNLRTALVAWLAAHATGGAMLLRIEDLDRSNSSRMNEDAQRADLDALGITFEPSVERQSDRFEIYRSVIAELTKRDLVYPCYCSRREIREAVSAPQGHYAHVPYPGICRSLSAADRRDRESSGRRPALRLRTDGEVYTVNDRVAGESVLHTDDFVLERNDGVPSYNLAVVVDDELQGVDQVVRGDDLLSSTGRHVHLQTLLGFRTPEFAHVPLVLGGDGERLAKRHGAVTLSDLSSLGASSADVLRVLAHSIGVDIDDPREAVDLLNAFSWDRMPRSAWTIPGPWQTVDR